MIRAHAVALEASSFCQLRCPTCPTTLGTARPAIAGGFLKLGDFRRLLAANPRLRHVELSNYGEAFLNPELEGILEEGFRRRVALTLGNGTNLNSARPTALEAVVRYRLRNMTCSIDGASNDTYRQYRVRGNFGRVIANIREINRWKKKLNSPYPHLRWQFVIFGHNEHEIARARQMAAELGMEFVAKLNWDPAFSPVRNAEAVRRESGTGAASREEYAAAHGMPYKHMTCHQLWERPQLNWDGTLLGCSRNHWGNFGGNAFTDGLDKCLSNEKVVYARQMLLGRQPPRADIPCSSCENYLHMQATGRWLDRGPAFWAGRASVKLRLLASAWRRWMAKSALR